MQNFRYDDTDVNLMIILYNDRDNVIIFIFKRIIKVAFHKDANSNGHSFCTILNRKHFAICLYILKNIKRKLQTHAELFIKEDHKIVSVWIMHEYEHYTSRPLWISKINAKNRNNPGSTYYTVYYYSHSEFDQYLFHILFKNAGLNIINRFVTY